MTNKVDFKRFNYFDILGTYTADVLQLFNSDATRTKLGNKLSDTIISLAKEKRDMSISDIKPKGGLVPDHFRTEMVKDFKLRGISKEWDLFGSLICEISAAPYLTELPKVINANPIYGEMHRQRIKLLKETESKGVKVGQVRDYHTRLLRFEEGILMLSTDSIFRLRESREFKDYREKIVLYNDSDATKIDVLDSLERYKNKIDDEILMRFREFREPKKFVREQFQVIDILNNISAYGGLILSGIAVAITSGFPGINEIGLGLNMTNLYLTKKKENNLAKAEILKLKLNEEMDQNPEKREISSEQFLNKNPNSFKMEVFYESVT